MNNERHFYHCPICGNLVGLLVKGGGTLVCCGKEMVELVPNTTDAAKEKHVPVITRRGNSVEVNVGGVDHPMIPEHFIVWIALAQGNHTQRVALKAGDKPHACFTACDGPVSAYAWCNLHGLWVAQG